MIEFNSCSESYIRKCGSEQDYQNEDYTRIARINPCIPSIKPAIPLAWPLMSVKKQIWYVKFLLNFPWNCKVFIILSAIILYESSVFSFKLKELFPATCLGYLLKYLVSLLQCCGAFSFTITHTQNWEKKKKRKWLLLQKWKNIIK